MIAMAAGSLQPALNAARPNIVLFLTDDQDQMLGSSFPTHGTATPMPKAQRLLADQGVTASNFFVHTPICCPSRNELLAGRYFHNIKTVPGDTPRPTKGDSCMHINETKVFNHTFARYLKEEAGYAVGLFGKFTNSWTGQWGRAPIGFDAWLANGGGDYMSPFFGVKGLKAFTGVDDCNRCQWKGNYTTAVVGNVSNAWIRHLHTTAPSTPFFAYVAPKAAHEPFNPAPWYVDHWDPSWPEKEPRPDGVWNASFASRADHHGNIATQPMITPDAAEVITGIFKNRWRCLMSVDDVIDSALSTVEGIGKLNSTYFFFTSDHGFQLGEYNMLMDKRHVYDFDTRVHLLVRGPLIPPGSTMPYIATFVDLAPTFLDIAGVEVPEQMDGKSMLPLLKANDKAAANEWRKDIVLEYYFVAPNDKCVKGCNYSKVGNWPYKDEYCVDLEGFSGCWGPAAGDACHIECYPTESPANNWRALRSVGDEDYLYAEFETGDQSQRDIIFEAPDFYELYEMDTDPWSLHNVYKSAPKARLEKMQSRLKEWYECAGAACP